MFAHWSLVTVARLGLGALRILERAKRGSLILMHLRVAHGAAVCAVFSTVKELTNDLLGWLLGRLFTVTLQVIEAMWRRLVVRRKQKMCLVAS